MSPIYEKEREGLKTNTVREIDLNDKRFLELIAHNMNGYNPGYIKIEIVNAQYPDEYFVRDINDITIWNNLMIISWTHRKQKK